MHPATPPDRIPSDADPKDLLALLARAAASDRALHFTGLDGTVTSRVSYRELHARLPGLARALTAATGLTPGRPILLSMPNCEALVSAFFAALHAGFIPAILAPLRPFGDAEAWAARVAAVSARTGSAPVVGDRGVVRALGGTAAGASIPVVAFETIAAATGPDAATGPVSRPQPGDTAFLQFTSGSLGDPKGVMLSHAAVVANALDTAARMAVHDGDRFVFWVPLVHDMATMSLMTGIAAGVDQWILPTEAFAADPLTWLRVLEGTGATCTSGPPFAFEMARRRAKRAGRTFELKSLRAAVVGAEPIDPRVLRAFSNDLLGGRSVFLPSLGVAEMCCGATMHAAGPPLVTRHVRHPFAPGTAVRFAAADDPEAIELTGNAGPLATTRVRIVLPSGEVAGDGVFGALELQGASMMSGYWERPDATAAVFVDDPASGRWLRTGDLGFTMDGHLFITGREKDVIIIRGRHYFPEEIDALVGAIPGVAHRGAMSFGEIDPGGGPELVTVVVEEREALDEAARDALTRTIRETVADRLDLVVARVVFTPRGSLPRTSSGKPRRSEARGRWGAGAAR